VIFARRLQQHSPNQGAPRRGASQVEQHHLEGVLGTTLEVQAQGQAEGLLAVVLAEIERLELIFSRFVADSELNRWLAQPGRWLALSKELLALLQLSWAYQRLTGGAFHIGSDLFSQVWQTASQIGIEPAPAELEGLLDKLAQPWWQLSEDGRVAKYSGQGRVNLNAIAKGFIAEQAAAQAFGLAGNQAILVNIGGDLQHYGAVPITVGIAQPFSLADNLPPLCKIRLHNQALASSGGSRRGFRVAERWFSHLIDPRTGWPVEQTVAVSVIATTASSADALATAFSVLPPSESLALADQLGSVGCLIVEGNGRIHSNAFWQQQQTVFGGLYQ
jgi:FAD:protein FMN transferase